MKRTMLLGGFVLSLLILPTTTKAAALYFSAEKERVVVGEVTRLVIMLDTMDDTVNAVEIAVPIPDGVEVEGIETGNSVVSLWVRPPEFDRETKSVKMLGGIPGGFRGQAPVATILLKLTVPEGREIMFDTNAQILINDGEGTPAELIFEGARLEAGLTEPLQVTSKTNPNQNNWYNSRRVEVSWKKKEGAEYSIVLDDEPLTIPDIAPEDVEPPQIFEGVPDGIHYFHIQEKLDGTWGEPTHFRLQVDATAPESFEILREENNLVWNADDKGSGINHYEVKFVPQPFTNWIGLRGESPYKIGLVGKMFGGQLVVKAVDAAGGERESNFEVSGNRAAQGGLIVILAGGLMLFLLKIFKRRQKTI